MQAGRGLFMALYTLRVDFAALHVLLNRKSLALQHVVVYPSVGVLKSLQNACKPSVSRGIHLNARSLPVQLKVA